jgi:hypothetical protein
MNEFNPYAPPKADISLEADLPDEGGVWRDGPLLVMTKGAALPDHCLKCNLPTGGWTLKRKLMWHPPYWYLLILFNLIIYAIAAMIVRQTATVMVPLCEQHRRRRRRMIALAWVLVLSGVAAIVVGASYPDLAGPGVLAALVLFFAGLLTGAFGTQTAVPKRIDKRLVWLQKVHPEFLADLPPWTS